MAHFVEGRLPHFEVFFSAARKLLRPLYLVTDVVVGLSRRVRLPDDVSTSPVLLFSSLNERLHLVDLQRDCIRLARGVEAFDADDLRLLRGLCDDDHQRIDGLFFLANDGFLPDLALLPVLPGILRRGQCRVYFVVLVLDDEEK